MLWLERWKARRQPGFEAAVRDEIVYLQRRYGDEAAGKSHARLMARSADESDYFIVEEAVRRLQRGV